MTGRNNPCPCGSGKKYKKCCGSVSSMTKGAKRPYSKKSQTIKVPMEQLLPAVMKGVLAMEKRGLIPPEPK